MAPIRRYLRITSSSVLEVRIYLDNPSLASSWLLRPRDPVLPRVIEAVRPLVLPKVKEENERDRSRGKLKAKKKGLKDTVVEDEFEVSIFLTPTTTRHSLLTKNKRFRDSAKPAMHSNSAKLTGPGMTSDAAIELGDEVDTDVPIIAEETDDEEGFFSTLHDIPSYTGSDEETDSNAAGKRRRGSTDGLFVEPGAKRKKKPSRADEDHGDDKKKMAMDVSYDGFSIWGRVLYLIVKKRETQSGREKEGDSSRTGGKEIMENWIASTQAPVGEDYGFS